MPSDPNGVVFTIQRFSLHDGPGVRTTVFLKGCPLRCAWCHNPEAFARRPHVVIAPGRCAGCGACAAACRGGALSPAPGLPRIDIGKCAACGACAAACPTGAASVAGRAVTADEVMDVVVKDRAYYARSGGGVTFSGGEPTAQFGFLRALLARCRAAGLSTALETSGVFSPARLAALAGGVDLFLLDYKLTREEDHRRHTGASNRAVLATLARLDRLGKDVILRCPVIPGINDTDGHFAAIRALRAAYPAIRRVDVMPYHAAGAGKWAGIGLRYALAGTPAPTPEDKARWMDLVGEGAAPDG